MSQRNVSMKPPQPTFSPLNARSFILNLVIAISLVPLTMVLVLFGQSVFAAEVTLAWNPNAEEDLAGYKVYYGTSSRNYEVSPDVGNFTGCTTGGLEEGQTYYLAVTAYDMSGNESNFSKEVSVTISDTGTSPFPLKIEAGEVRVDDNWTWVEFTESFLDPVVVAKPLSLSDEDPAVVRIRNVDQSGFEIRIQEWDYLDGTHALETICYLAMERGTYTLTDGIQVEADEFETKKTSSFGGVAFSQSFHTAPVVAATASTFNGGDTVTGRIRNITTQGFEFCMREQELNSQTHTTETISYIAWEPSSGILGGLAFEVNRTPDVVRHDLHTIQFNQAFVNVPVFLADMQTTDGGNTANLRWTNRDFSGVDVQVDEEQSRDSEINHTTEVVGYLAFAMEGP